MSIEMGSLCQWNKEALRIEMDKTTVWRKMILLLALFAVSSSLPKTAPSILIWVVYQDSGCLKVLGFFPRKLAEYLSPLMDQYSLNLEGCVTSVPKHSIDVVPIQIVCHKSNDAEDFNDDTAFKCLWRNVQQVIESTKSCPPCAIKYQDNFCVFIREVLRNSSHLLTDDEKNFIESFTSMSEVRLCMRKEAFLPEW